MNAPGKDILFPRMALIGAGLIGSSLARVARREGLAGHIAVSARTQATLDKAMELGFADSVSLDAGEAAKDADLVVLCTPLGAYGSIAEAIATARPRRRDVMAENQPPAAAGADSLFARLKAAGL